MSKKILYISYDGMTDPLGQSQVIPYLRELTKLGFQFTLLSVEKKDRMAKNGEHVKQVLASAGIKWETLPFTSTPPVLSKLYDQIKLNTKASQLHKRDKYDLIHCRSYVAAEAGLKLFKRFNVPFLFDMRGFWVDERVDSGLWKQNNPLYKWFYKIYKRKENVYFAKSTHIISLTNKGKEELVKNYQVVADKISVIPCCADLQHFDYRSITEEKKQEIRNQLSIDSSKKVLTYLGSLGGWYMTNEMLDFFAVMKVRIPEAIFLFITHDKPAEIIKIAADRGISTEYIRVQAAARNDVPLYLSISDWSIFFIKDVYSKKASSPTKQGEIMAMGIPIVCNDIGDTGYIINKSASGVLCNNFTNAEYSELVKVLQEKEFNKNKIRGAAIDFFDLSQGVLMYKNVYKQITK